MIGRSCLPAINYTLFTIRPNGSDAGHNGLKNINEVLGHNKYARLRFGIGNDFPKGQQVDFVLGKWTNEEQAALKPRINQSIHAILSFASQGLGPTMSSFNNK